MRKWVAYGAKTPQAMPGTLLDRQPEQRRWGHFGQVGLEEAGIVFLQRAHTLLDTSWPRHILVIHEAGVLDNSILSSPVKVNEPHIHFTAVHNPASFE